MADGFEQRLEMTDHPLDRRGVEEIRRVFQMGVQRSVRHLARDDRKIEPGPLPTGHRELLEHAAELVRDCPCLAGCPSCIGPLHLVEGAKEACLKLLSVSALPV